MVTAILRRLFPSDQGTFGKIYLPNGITLFTGELPWRNNQRTLSSIPEGEYECVYTYSPRFKKFTYEVKAVKGRSAIRIHSANFMGDTYKGYRSQLNGCIALGERIGKLDGQLALLLSRPAISKLEKIMNKQPFKLIIINKESRNA